MKKAEFKLRNRVLLLEHPAVTEQGCCVGQIGRVVTHLNKYSGKLGVKVSGRWCVFPPEALRKIKV